MVRVRLASHVWRSPALRNPSKTVVPSATVRTHERSVATTTRRMGLESSGPPAVPGVGAVEGGAGPPGLGVRGDGEDGAGSPPPPLGGGVLDAATTGGRAAAWGRVIANSRICP